ncbi:uncharacterized protein LOC117429200 isoform X6 [Acipenser ruthenus]|uniref:uncharacterized protein LOC117429200 isoform X6 n=1 Tax=Acipenser ruthenus TaxID=7906 RepID=UPI0027423887|nr:uncharacterized protein LOC117429200 isoform X6 [Acipenser ruthenus]XP_058855204.1 uncharacterized protein LOC117429200 isoform X6 [Acipenser ruthenus]
MTFQEGPAGDAVVPGLVTCAENGDSGDSGTENTASAGSLPVLRLVGCGGSPEDIRPLQTRARRGAVCGREARPVHPEPDCLRDPGEPPRPGQPPLHPPPPQGAGHDSVARRGSGWLLHRQEESGTAGSLCGGCTSLCYQLPVLDTVFVRRSWRRRGLCLEMLEGYCSSFNGEEVLGISYPVSTAMYQVCRKYLLAHPEQRDRLYEAEPPGHWSQRQSIWLQIQLGKIPSADEQQAAAERILLEESRADSSAQEGLRKESPDFVPAAAACPSKLKRKGGATLEEVTPKVKK